MFLVKDLETVLGMSNVIVSVILHSKMVDQRCSTQADQTVDDLQSFSSFPNDQSHQRNKLQYADEHVVPHGYNIAELSFLERSGVQSSNLVILFATGP